MMERVSIWDETSYVSDEKYLPVWIMVSVAWILLDGKMGIKWNVGQRQDSEILSPRSPLPKKPATISGLQLQNESQKICCY